MALEASGPGRSGVAFVLDTQNNFHHLAHDEDVFEWELVSSVPGQGYAGATYLWLGDGL